MVQSLQCRGCLMWLSLARQSASDSLRGAALQPMTSLHLAVI